jgi:integrase
VATVKAARLFGVNRRYLFPSARHAHRPITENALNVAYRRVAGFEGKHVPHGWRSTFSTIMNERAIEQNRPADRAIIDLMLAHVPKDKVESAYNRASYMPRRRELAQEWADLISEGLAPVESLLAVPRR